MSNVLKPWIIKSLVDYARKNGSNMSRSLTDKGKTCQIIDFLTTRDENKDATVWVIVNDSESNIPARLHPDMTTKLETEKVVSITSLRGGIFILRDLKLIWTKVPLQGGKGISSHDQLVLDVTGSMSFVGSSGEPPFVKEYQNSNGITKRWELIDAKEDEEVRRWVIGLRTGNGNILQLEKEKEENTSKQPSTSVTSAPTFIARPLESLVIQSYWGGVFKNQEWHPKWFSIPPEQLSKKRVFNIDPSAHPATEWNPGHGAISSSEYEIDSRSESGDTLSGKESATENIRSSQAPTECYEWPTSSPRGNDGGSTIEDKEEGEATQDSSLDIPCGQRMPPPSLSFTENLLADSTQSTKLKDEPTTPIIPPSQNSSLSQESKIGFYPLTLPLSWEHQAETQIKPELHSGDLLAPKVPIPLATARTEATSSNDISYSAFITLAQRPRYPSSVSDDTGEVDTTDDSQEVPGLSDQFSELEGSVSESGSDRDRCEEEVKIKKESQGVSSIPFDLKASPMPYTSYNVYPSLRGPSPAMSQTRDSRTVSEQSELQPQGPYADKIAERQAIIKQRGISIPRPGCVPTHAHPLFKPIVAAKPRRTAAFSSSPSPLSPESPKPKTENSTDESQTVQSTNVSIEDISRRGNDTKNNVIQEEKLETEVSPCVMSKGVGSAHSGQPVKDSTMKTMRPKTNMLDVGFHEEQQSTHRGATRLSSDKGKTSTGYTHSVNSQNRLQGYPVTKAPKRLTSHSSQMYDGGGLTLSRSSSLDTVQLLELSEKKVVTNLPLENPSSTNIARVSGSIQPERAYWPPPRKSKNYHRFQSPDALRSIKDSTSSSRAVSDAVRATTISSPDVPLIQLTAVRSNQPQASTSNQRQPRSKPGQQAPFPSPIASRVHPFKMKSVYSVYAPRVSPVSTRTSDRDLRLSFPRVIEKTGTRPEADELTSTNQRLTGKRGRSESDVEENHFLVRKRVKTIPLSTTSKQALDVDLHRTGVGFTAPRGESSLTQSRRSIVAHGSAARPLLMGSGNDLTKARWMNPRPGVALAGSSNSTLIMHEERPPLVDLRVMKPHKRQSLSSAAERDRYEQ